MSGSGLNLAGIMGDVARKVLGEPNGELSSDKELCFGTHGSVKVKIAGEKRGTWFDHENDVGGGVLDLLREKKRLQKDDALNWLREHRLIQGSANSAIVATYPYQDAEGTLVYEAVRMEPKTFRLRRPDGTGGWTWSLKGVDRLPYRLPDLLATHHPAVFIAEGEKDVDNLRAAGLTATCNPGGSLKWQASFSQYFSDWHRIIILPDNDKAGEEHAADVAAKLKGSAVASIRILRLPGLPEKGDVSDWLAAGGTADQLLDLAGDAPEAEVKEKLDPDELHLVDPTSLLHLAVPERRWIVQDWLPVGYTTIDFGDGGTGKTLLAQQLMTSCATGALWCGLSTMRCRTLGLFCEDDEDELHRRQDNINDALGLHFSDLGEMRWASGVGQDNILMLFPSGQEAELTPRYHRLIREAKAFGAKLVVIDTAADTFGGNENARPEVRQFIGRALNNLAREIGGAVLLNAHPSVRGMGATGDMDGGSTAWSNTARSRWSLVRPIGEDGREHPDERVLARRKANYAQKGVEIRLRWERGVLAPVEDQHPATGFGRIAADAAVDELFMRLLDDAVARGRRVSESKHATNYAPKLFALSPDAAGNNRRAFVTAMERLFHQGAICLEGYGRTGDARQCIVRAAPRNNAKPE